MITVDQKREAIRNLGNYPEWNDIVDKMSDNNIRFTYIRLMAKGKLQGENCENSK